MKVWGCLIVDVIGTYQEHVFPKSRTTTIDWVDVGRSKRHIPILVELDATAARSYIQNLKETSGEGLSFTGWVIKCIGQAVSEHKHVHAMRKGSKKLIVFDDVDISIAVERATGDSHNRSETLPMPYVVRRANQKSVIEIHNEIRAAQTERTEAGVVGLGAQKYYPYLQNLFFSLPSALRKLILYRRLVSDPFFAKKMMGTVVVTSVGMFGKGGGGSSWGIPAGIHPLGIALGGIARKPGIVGDRVEVREYLGMTILFDHDVTDGAPVARFVQRLRELIENAYGLE
jgi:pyruvate/2-oxoglutarate dehydrogenase complex dihydrolipoamide acyltransferase (E2) component